MDGVSRFGAQPVDLALEVEQGVEALHRLQGDRIDRPCPLAAALPACCCLNIGQLEELAARMGKTARFEPWRWTTSGCVELAVAAIGVCLQDPGPAIEMGLRVFSAPVARIVEQRGRRIGTAEWPVVADIDPQ